MDVAPTELQKHLKGIDYPADKQTLIETARKEGAGENIIHLLEKFPDKDYNGPSEVMKAYGQVRE